MRCTRMELGADDYLTKPCTPDELLSGVVKIKGYLFSWGI